MQVHLPPNPCLCPSGDPEWTVVKLILGDARSEKSSLIHLDMRSCRPERLGDDAFCVCVLAQLSAEATPWGLRDARRQEGWADQWREVGSCTELWCSL